ncbi:dermonecrotic toxin domain-containing protein [Luteibacter sp. UNCMF366Tsu5.1]|uniref:dermonecrotic toxin domain-containing protein n=1 Tax=Luteibacter sp. UNCMF366Tsu5.1 TaxID=1502758 RepID=UPI000909032B|nr:DUF6543 domain-containing protein [Luteibacter sp. UNCMF366Tsu5.1]SFW55711.1 hypothetical protein SAMN02800691_2125 [Luteibacter sp. UNCMF366Tsu5.1]
MRHSLPLTRLAAGLALALVGAISVRATPAIDATGDTTINTLTQDGRKPVAAPTFAPLFATEADARIFWTMTEEAQQAPVPEPRLVAKAFIKAHLNVDGDDYVVAHFASAKTRKEGKPDQIVKLTDALMEAFPEHSRHSFFAASSDVLGGVLNGGASPSHYKAYDQLMHSRSAMDFFSHVGKFLWSRAGLGYVRNTLFAKGNVVDTAYEDFRLLDDAFGVFRANAGFARRPDFRLSQILDKLGVKLTIFELPYVKKLHEDFDTYWKRVGPNWATLARYRFVEEARRARASGVLTQAQFERVMAGGAPNTPLQGPLTMQQLRGGKPRSVQARRFDIHGYTSTNLLRFVSSDNSEVLYIPGRSPGFVTFADEAGLRRWVADQAKDSAAFDDLMSRFSLYDQQDGLFWSGVHTSLQNIASGHLHAEDKLVDNRNALINGDVFEDMRARTENRLRHDAKMSVSTSWEAWRTTLKRGEILLTPLTFVPGVDGFVVPVTMMLDLGLSIDSAIHGRTFAERKAGLQGIMTFVTTASLKATSPGVAARPDVGPAYQVDDLIPAREFEQFGLAPMERINGRIGYPLSPVGSPRLPAADAEVPQADVLPPNYDEDAPSTDLAAPAAANPADAGYLVQVVPGSSQQRSSQVNEVLRRNIETQRARLDDFRAESLRINGQGYQVSTDHSLVYRYDIRTPEQLLSEGGFGASGNDDVFGTFNGVPSMLSTPSTRGNRTMQAADRAYMHRIMDHAVPLQPGQVFHEYAVWTEGREVASVSDNANVVPYDPSYAEVHFPHDIAARDIYIFGSGNPRYAAAIADIFESPHVSTPYGVPLEALVEYLAGRLNINLPNRFSEQRPAHYLDLPSSSESSMNDVQSLP